MSDNIDYKKSYEKLLDFIKNDIGEWKCDTCEDGSFRGYGDKCLNNCEHWKFDHNKLPKPKIIVDNQ